MAELKDLLDFAAEQGVHAIEVTLLLETLQEIERLQIELATLKPGYEEALHIIERQAAWIADKETLASAVVSLREELEQAKERERQLQQTLHSIDALILKESPVGDIQRIASVERRILRMIEEAFNVESENERLKHVEDNHDSYLIELQKRKDLESANARLQQNIEQLQATLAAPTTPRYTNLVEDNARLREVLTSIIASPCFNASECLVCGSYNGEHRTQQCKKAEAALTVPPSPNDVEQTQAINREINRQMSVPPTPRVKPHDSSDWEESVPPEKEKP